MWAGVLVAAAAACTTPLPHAAVGGGTPLFDGIHESVARLMNPWGVAAVRNTTSGGVILYIGNYVNQTVLRVDEQGLVWRALGTGSWGSTINSSSALNSFVQNPTGVAATYNATSGRATLYVADNLNNRVLKVSETGSVTGAMAVASVRGVAAIPHTSSGTNLVYAVGSNCHCVRWIDSSNSVANFAGNGSAAFGGDDGPSNLAALNAPYGVAAVRRWAGEAPTVYIADTSNHRIRMVSTDGWIFTVAGTGAPGNLGDGYAATAAQLHHPRAVAAVANEETGQVVLFIGEISGAPGIRRVDEAGIITTIVSGGSPYAVSALLNTPNSIHDVTLYYSSNGDGRVYGMCVPSPSATPSVSPTASTSPSITASASASPSATSSLSSTRSATPTRTSSRSVTPSHSSSASSSISATVSPSCSQTHTPSRSVSGSVTPSVAALQTPSTSVDGSQAASTSGSASPSATPPLQATLNADGASYFRISVFVAADV
ncbi:hypothetical protein EON66_05405 [archaeon]|nr:MAG: hypothetical protein EON66_05405 [archaeon]